jgi:formate hydrogenlyase transcriptional activator
MCIGPKGGSCGTAVYRREPVYANDILNDPIWDHYRHLMLPFGIRAVWSRPLFANDGRVLGTFAIHYREVRKPSVSDLQLIENAGHIAGIAIERHLEDEQLCDERDRLRLLLEITNSMTSKLDYCRLVDALSTNLFKATRCDFCALLLPSADRKQLRITALYNPESRGSISDGALVPIQGSACGKAFRTGKSDHINSLEAMRDDPDSFGTDGEDRFFEQLMAEGLKSGCELPLMAEVVSLGYYRR